MSTNRNGSRPCFVFLFKAYYALEERSSNIQSFQLDPISGHYGVGSGVDPTQSCKTLHERIHANGRHITQAIMTRRGNCALSCRNVFFRFNWSAEGWSLPSKSVARETSVCSPGVAPSHRYVKSFHEYRVWPGVMVAGRHG